MLDFKLEDLITLEQAMNTHFVMCYTQMADSLYKTQFLARLTYIQKELATEIERRANK